MRYQHDSSLTSFTQEESKMANRFFLFVLFTLSCCGARSHQTIDYLADRQRLGVKRGQRQSRALEDEEEANGTIDATLNAVASKAPPVLPRILALTLRTVTKDVSYAGK